MKSKANKTKQFILESVAPVFNKKGYSGTSMSDLTEVTGLTKGAIYGNFTNKEELAVEAFNYNIRLVMGKLRIIFDEIESPIAKLFALSNFYRGYLKVQLKQGGCPVLNVGVDTVNTNPKLHVRVKDVSRKLQASIADIIENGKLKGEIKQGVNSDQNAGRIFSMIEGGVFTASLMDDESYLKDMMNLMDDYIHNNLKI